MVALTGQAVRPAACTGAIQQQRAAARSAFSSRPRPAVQHAPRAVERSTARLVARASSQNLSTEPAGPVSDSDFDELVLKSDVPVLVDFWAPWCGPCRMIAPIVDELAVQFEGKIKAYKLNTDDSPRVAGEYGIRSIPTVMFFKDGQKMDTVIGAVPKSTLVQTIEKYL